MKAGVRWKEANLVSRLRNISCVMPPLPVLIVDVSCLLKESGGLGVPNLRTQNEALLLKNLHKFFNKLDIPWVNLIWERYYPASHIKKGSF
ncbi:hypothetical protein U9M48_002601 [Paspalum notatum var. saurae]|uniref:Uncharacterized protein n=1 Tax=Paspalum notatum var. saurae TaxID=547442 RepID=A0AAQ3PJQ9_PASNO